MSTMLEGVLSSYQFKFDNSEQIDVSLSLAELDQMIHSLKEKLPKDSRISPLIIPVLEMSMVANASFEMFKKNSASFPQSKKHKLVDLWSEGIALRSLTEDILKESENGKNNSNEINYKLDAVIESAHNLLTDVIVMATTFYELRTISPLFDKIRGDLKNSQELLDRVKFSKETSLPF